MLEHNNNMLERGQHIRKGLEVIFKLLFLITGFMFFSNITFAKPILSLFMWSSIFVGGIVILWRLFLIKNFIKSKYLWLLIIFAISHMISSLLNISYGYYENFKLLIWMAFQFGILYAYDKTRTKEDMVREFHFISHIFIISVFILSFISFQYIFGNKKSYFTFLETGYLMRYGFSWGRLFGAYLDPNYAAVFAVISCVLSIYYCIRWKKWWTYLIYGLNIVLQLGYITFSDSRTGKLSLCVSFGFMTYMLAIFYFRKKFNNSKKYIVGIITTGIVVILLTLIPVGIKSGYNVYIATKEAQQEEKNPVDEDMEDLDDEEDKKQSQEIGREEDIEGDISNRRFDLWKSGVEIFKTKPIFGVSFKNILSYVEKEIPSSYLITNDHGKFDNMHNVIFNIIPAQGVVGIVIFIAIALAYALFIFKNLKVVDSTDYIWIIVLLTCIGTAVCSMMFVTDVIYAITPSSFLFWLFLGYIVQYIEAKKTS